VVGVIVVVVVGLVSSSFSYCCSRFKADKSRGQ